MIKILMIDDNVRLIDAVKEYFKNNKEIEIKYEAYNGLDGMQMVLNKKDDYDLILLDLIMPKKDGLYVLEEMKKNNIVKNVIVETSYNASEVIREVAEYDVNYFLLKPFELCDLEKKLLIVLRKNQMKI